MRDKSDLGMSLSEFSDKYLAPAAKELVRKAMAGEPLSDVELRLLIELRQMIQPFRWKKEGPQIPSEPVGKE